MPKPKGRPPGLLIHAEGFEALIAARGLLKKDIAADNQVSPGYIGDLLAHRCGAGRDIAARLASSLGVRQEALFPELAGWVAPLPDREAKRETVGV